MTNSVAYASPRKGEHGVVFPMSITKIHVHVHVHMITFLYMYKANW